MSYPHFPLQVQLTIAGVFEADNIVMGLSRLLPFPPRDGTKIRLWREDEETLDLDLEEVVYSFRDSAFLVELEIDVAVESYRAGEGDTRREWVDYYTSFGFKRLNYPQGQVIRGSK